MNRNEARFTFLSRDNPADASQDQDNDGLTNLQEFQTQSDPANPDTDGDGLPDGGEVNHAAGATNPLKADTDGDGLPDGAETGTGTFKSLQDTGTDPLKADTDDDGFVDLHEAINGSDPTRSTSVPGAGPPLVILDATQLAEGPLPVSPNTGALPGSFVARDTNAAPAVVSVAGVKGVSFNGNEYYTVPAAPLWITGDGARTIEAWVCNPATADEETIFAWGRRGGPDGSNCSFNHGVNAL